MRTSASLLLLLLLALPACRDDSGADAGVDATAGLDAAADATIRDSGPMDAGLCVLPAFDRACTTPADCIVAVHMINCCGTERHLGINHSERARFDAFETACVVTYPSCGCPPQPPVADDGTMPPGMPVSGEPTLECLAGVCTTTFAP